MSQPRLALVDYSDSSSDDEAAPPPPKLRKTSADSAHAPAPESLPSTLPPLPSRFLDLYAVNPRVGKDDDPTLHGGRKRSIPHVQGNWPTHVYIEWYLSRTEFDRLDALYNAAADAAKVADTEFKLETHLKSDLGSEQPLHVSLSRPCVLRTEQREGFLETLTDRIYKARLKPFTVEFTGFSWVRNQDSTRWFFVLDCTTGPKNELPRLLDLSNRTVQSFNQPPLLGTHGDGSSGFHASLGWSLTKPSPEVEKKVAEAVKMKGNGVTLEDEVTKLMVSVDAIKVKIGNVLHVVEVGAHVGDEACETRKRRMS
ncbi:hypothetical protein EX30DRAFT_318270 [Ascodesmis nigricans]|uniref:U6 snRNA phosphodiesterase n=1 Tax=Ascodesmis nigricans TaxID=341454 RepID=A0A4S2N000_9PEZI|nr:hypothetical protein EX30DRAFT_318270 [Ascodesmis nigricans]